MKGANRTVRLLEQFVDLKKSLASMLQEKGEEASVNDTFKKLVDQAGEYIPKSYVFVDENGNEVAGVLVSEETVFTAGVNDVREGKTFATETGVETGEKFIPSYTVSEGYRIITSGKPFIIPLATLNKYDFTKLQALICPYAGSIEDSVAAEKVAINESVYPVKYAKCWATVTKDHQNKQINLGFSNGNKSPYVIRYFTYKEIY